MIIKRNIGGFDRVLRVGISLFMIYFGFFSTVVISDVIAGTILGILGIFSLFIAIIGYCPFYSVIGFSSYQSLNNSR